MVDQVLSPMNGEWRQFDLQNLVVLANSSALPGPPSLADHDLIHVDQYVALRVNADGVVVSVGNGDGAFASGSCAGSLYVAG
jgi:PqqD family protein of HPr-rel-A system